MSRYTGKFVGAILGFTLGGPSVALIGFIIGHLRDIRVQPAIGRTEWTGRNDLFPDFIMGKHEKAIFSQSVIALGAKLAKADGIVRREEVLAFRRVFRTPESQLDTVGLLFDRFRKSADGYETYAARMAQVFGHNGDLLEEVLVGLFYIAIADSYRLARSEMLYLRRVSVIFGFSESDFERIAGRVGLSLSSSPPPPKRDSAYDVLGLPTTASVQVIKQTYRVLVRKHHPDKLIAAGMPSERVAEATEKIKMINAAYAEICRLRNIK